MIEARGLAKHYGSTVAVDDLSFEVHEGQVTGFLGAAHYSLDLLDFPRCSHCHGWFVGHCLFR